MKTPENIYNVGDRVVIKAYEDIIHKGANGIAQASAYALKKIYEKMNGGEL